MSTGILCLISFLVTFSLAADSYPEDYCPYNGQIVPNPNNDYSYIICRNHLWHVVLCPKGYEFDNDLKKCLIIATPPAPPTYPTRICTPGNKKSYFFDDTKYYECSKDGTKWLLKSCSYGKVFEDGSCRYLKPPTTTSSTTTTTASTRCQESAGPSGYKPDPYDCTKYYQCVHGNWMQRPCGPGTAWNQYILACDHYDSACKQHYYETATLPSY